jgi:hypothetical protein
MPMTDGTAKEARQRTITRMIEARIAGRRTGNVTRAIVRRVLPPQTREDSSSAMSKEPMAGAMIR